MQTRLFAIDATVYSERYSHSQFMTLKMKDAIVDYFVAKHRKRPSIDTKIRISNSTFISTGNWLLFLWIVAGPHYLSVVTEKNRRQLLSMKYWQQECFSWLVGMEKETSWIPCAGRGTLLIEAGMVAMDLPANLQKRIRFYELEELTMQSYLKR